MRFLKTRGQTTGCKLLASAATAAALAVAPSAQALQSQTDDQDYDVGEVADPAVDDTPANTADNAAPVQGGQIIVSARRRSETLQDTPVAITAIQPAQLAATGTLDIGDLQGTAPNLIITAQPTGAAAANISIRGIAFADVEKSFDPAVGVYVDGVYIGTSTGQYLDFFDIESIEVLRGPQGTLFGRNTIAGVVNIQRTRPTLDWDGKFQASIAEYGKIGLRGVVNVPIIQDVLGVKLFEFHEQSDGFQRDSVTGQNLGETNSENFGAAILFEPSPDFDALLTLEMQDQDYDAQFGSLTQTGDVFCGFLPSGACDRDQFGDDIYTVFRAMDAPGFYESKAATLEMNWRPGNVTVTSITSYRESDEGVVYDIGTTGLYIADRAQTYDQFSQEFRLAGDLFDGFDYVAGLYYFESDYQLLQTTTVFGAFAGDQDTQGHSESYAAFIDFNWEVFQDVRLSGGGRFTYDKKAYRNPLLYTGAAREDWNKFTPKVTIDYRPTEDLLMYASWSRGYRSGGFNGRGLTVFSAQTPYDPETVDSYEVGLKSQFFDRRVSLNAAAFYTDYTDIQQASTITLAGGQGNETIVTNAAGAKIKGFEVDFSARLIEGLTLGGAVGYTDAEFEGFIVNQPVTLADQSIVTRTFDFSGVDPIFAPEWTVSLTGDYTVPVGSADVTFHVGYRFLSPYDQQIAPPPSLYPGLLADPMGTSTVIVPNNDPRVRSDKQNLLDASVTAEFPMNDYGAKMYVTGFVRNLLDDKGPSFAFTVAAYPNLWAYTVPREPQVFGAEVGFEF